ncbi:MAG: DNA-binding protein [bacterium]|nr:DNA-binding protein [bacterium]
MNIVKNLPKKIEKRALAPRDVSFMYGISEGTLANWRCKREGPKFYKIGGRKVVYLLNDLDVWVRSNPVLTKEF